MLGENYTHREIALIMGVSRGTVSGHAAQIKRNKSSFGPPAGFDVRKVTERFDGEGNLVGKTERSEVEQEEIFGEFDKGIFSVPEGMFAEKATTLYRGDGSLDRQWVKAKFDLTKRKILFDAWIEEIRSELPRVDPTEPSLALKDLDILSAYVIGDAHFGMMSWGEETGNDFDLKIAEAELMAATKHLIRCSPDGREGLLVNVGDFAHTNSRKSVTPGNGNLLDSDSRYMKMVRVIMRVFRQMIREMLLKYDHVKIICAPGNHDPDTANWIALTLAIHYENEPRVTVDTHPGAFFYHQFGECLIGVTHGDTCKFQDLPQIMAADMAKAWGETEHRHFFTGHIHHTKQQEYPGVFVESFNTLAPGDAWHVASGYRAKRQMQRLDFHARNGVFGRAFVHPGML
jgi:hypothetical protein